MSGNWWTYWWLLAFVSPLALYFMPVQFRSWCRYEAGWYERGIRLALLGGRISMEYPLPSVKVGAHQGSDLASLIRRSVTLFGLVRKPINVSKLEVNFRVGMGDAALTGLAVGTLYALIHSALASLHSWVTLHTGPRLNVVPDYTQACFVGRVGCIVDMRLGDIITVIAVIGIRWVLKGMVRTWKNIPYRV